MSKEFEPTIKPILGTRVDISKFNVGDYLNITGGYVITVSDEKIELCYSRIESNCVKCVRTECPIKKV
jgi:hypothetical protein